MTVTAPPDWLPSFPALAERSASVDQFDILERVEMGQMASMFFNKGEQPPGSSDYVYL